MASLYEEEVVEEKKVPPFEKVFGSRVTSLAQQNSTIGLSYAKFKEIKWPLTLPYFICDFLKTITGFSMKK